MTLNSITVYCGSSSGKDPAFIQAATALGECFLKHGIKLVYGGGDDGLMGQIARTVAKGGGKVTGVTPEFMHTEGLSNVGPGEHIVIDTMHARKQYMFEIADAFIALPGGFGTMEELVEMITWVQLGLHNKPIGILNVKDYYRGFLNWVSHANNENFIRNCTSIFVTSDNAEDLVQKLSELKKNNNHTLSCSSNKSNNS